MRRPLAAALIVALASFCCHAAEPDEEDPYFLLSEQADKAIAAGDYESAAQRIHEAMAVEPDAPQNVLLLSNLGMVYSYLDRDSLALEAFGEALRRAPSMRTVLANRARVLLKMRRDAAARADLDRLIELDSVNTEGRYLRGMLSLAYADTATAHADFDVLAALQPESQSTATAMAAYLTATKQYAKAEPYLRRVLSFDPQADYYDILANVLIDSERYSEAGTVLAEGIEKFPDNADLYYCRARLHKCLYDNKAAEADTRMARRLERSRRQ